MSQPNNNITLQVSGEEEKPPATTTPYSLQQYLTSPSGVTDRLLQDFSASKVVDRAQAVADEMRRLANIISQ
ncbi:hypothetical protein N0V88_000630 [Collariella sp. IMI 366227]|nr:hypothetical protein N0V88_000630 [Collariella sp. IMI 366227]